MTTLRIRPRFKQIVEKSCEEIESSLVERLSQENCLHKRVIVQRTVTLKIPEKEQHFWTPQLNLTL